MPLSARGSSAPEVTRPPLQGKLGIHAGSGVDRAALDAYGHLLDGDLPRGALIGTVGVVDCVQNSRSRWAEPGLWHWVLADPKMLVHRRPMPGKLGIWNT